MTAGATDYFIKPLEIDSLIDAVRNAAESNRRAKDR